jgi:hypothetical protein
MPKQKHDRHFINGESLVLELPATIEDVCCDCGLVHFRFLYEEKGKLVIRTFRDDHSTRKLKNQKKR